MDKSILAGLGEPTSGKPPTGQQFCGDIDMTIARDGTWFYHGSPIGRKQMVKLFSTILHRDEGGDYWLETPVEKCRIQVEDAPFIAVEMTATGEGQDQILKFRTNLDELIEAGPVFPIRVAIDPDSAEPSPYVAMRDGLEALIGRAVFYDLVDLGVEEDRGAGPILGIWSGGEFFELGPIGEGGN